MHSWRALILPYLGHEDLWKAYRMSEPWDSPHNLKLAKSAPREYQLQRALETPSIATCVAVVGDETIWPEHGRVRMDDVVDGLDNTIILGEVSNEQGVSMDETS